MVKNPQKTLGETTFIVFGLIKDHNFSLSRPILIIFVAKMINFYVKIAFMMTRNLWVTIKVSLNASKED